MPDDKPKASGSFALIWGVLFLAISPLALHGDIQKLAKAYPNVLLGAWLLLAGLILIYWGINRRRKSTGTGPFGQDTINCVIAILGVTFALVQLLPASP